MNKLLITMVLVLAFSLSALAAGGKFKTKQRYVTPAPEQLEVIQGTKKVRPREGRSLLDPLQLPERGVRRRRRLTEHPILSRVESPCDSLALGEINEHLRFAARTHHFWCFLRCLLGLVCHCSGRRRCAHPVELRWWWKNICGSSHSYDDPASGSSSTGRVSLPVRLC